MCVSDTGWRRLIGCLKLQVIFRNRANNYRALLRKITYENKASYATLYFSTSLSHLKATCSLSFVCMCACVCARERERERVCEGRVCPSINLVCKILKTALRNLEKLSVAQFAIEFPADSSKRDLQIVRSHQSEVLQTRLTIMESSIANFLRFEFPADFSKKRPMKNDAPAK